MGNKVVFTGRSPELSGIANKIVELSGLPVSIESKSDSCFDIVACLSFTGFPANKLKITAYSERRLKIGNSHQQTRHSSKSIDKSSAEECDTQTVFQLQIYSVQEPTLFFASIVALEQLGGRSEYPYSEIIEQKYLINLTATELKRRSQQIGVSVIYSYVVTIILLPILIPYWIVQSIFIAITIEKVRTNPDKYLED